MTRIKIIITIATVLFITACTSLTKLNTYKNKNKYKLTTENDLQDAAYAKKIDDFYEKGTAGFFIGKENIKIYYKIFKQEYNEKAAIVISSGRTEAAIKYKELIFDLYKRGYSIYISDHRGQGLSGRMLKEHDMGYIDNFQYYVDDLKKFYDEFVIKDKHKNIFLMAHSMGGAIGMTYLEQYPKDFNAAAFSSPMLGLVSPTCAAVKVLEKKEPEYIMGGTPYQDDSVKFEDNTLTYSKIRYERILQAFNETTDARLGSPSYQWVTRSCKQFKYIFENVDKIQTPLIIFSAKDEKIVAISAHKDFIKKLRKLKKDAEAYEVKDAMHELFIERDRARIDVITRSLDFFAEFEPDTRLHNIWVVTQFNGKELNREKYNNGLPRFEINTTKSRVLGNDGCNDFNGDIKIENGTISFGNLVSTKKACPNMDELKDLLKHISGKTFEYKFSENKVELLQKGKVILSLKNID